jgi:amino acid permease
MIGKISDLSLRIICWAMVFFPFPALAQYYDGYAEDIGGPTKFQKIMTGSFASLIMVLVGSAGLFNLFFATGKGEKSDKQQMIGALMVLAVIAMAWYRFSLWNDEDFNSKPKY